MHAVSTLLHVIPEGEKWETAWKTVTTLILKGIDGTTGDILRSCSLASACLKSCRDELIQSQFLTTMLRQFAHTVKQIERSMHIGLQHCIPCVLDLTEDRGNQLLWDLWSDLSVTNEIPTIVHLVDIYLSVLPSFPSFFIAFCPRFLYHTVTTLAAFNHDGYVHARLLRLFAELVPFIELVPVLSEGSWIFSHWKQQELALEKEKRAFSLLFHRNHHVLFIFIS